MKNSYMYRTALMEIEHEEYVLPELNSELYAEYVGNSVSIYERATHQLYAAVDVVSLAHGRTEYLVTYLSLFNEDGSFVEECESCWENVVVALNTSYEH